MLTNKLATGICGICCVCLLQGTDLYAQGQAMPANKDTIKLELKQAEKLFLDNNLELLAAHYHIRSTEALVEQARKWDNPVLNTDQNVYSNNRFFEHGRDAGGTMQGEVFAQVQQLIRTAGKRGKQVDMARTNLNIADWQFKSVLRNLRAVLIRDFYTIARLQGNAVLYNDNLERLNKLLPALDKELAAGNIAQKEHLRVQALLMSLQHDMAENDRSLNDAESELKTLLGIAGEMVIVPVVADTENAVMPDVTLLQLLDSAKHNNTDYCAEIYQLQYAQQNLRLQKALSVPDVTVGTEYDQASNYVPNYYGLAISLPIPLWDRNRGNIKSANWQVKEEDALLRHAEQKLQNEVISAYQKLLLAIRLNGMSNRVFYKDYYQLQKNIADSYNKRQIGLIEFLEYYKDYKEIGEQQLKQVLDLRMAKQELNDITGTNIIQ